MYKVIRYLKCVSKSNGPTMVMTLEGALLWYISLYMGTMCLSLGLQFLMNLKRTTGTVLLKHIEEDDSILVH